VWGVGVGVSDSNYFTEMCSGSKEGGAPRAAELPDRGTRSLAVLGDENVEGVVRAGGEERGHTPPPGQEREAESEVSIPDHQRGHQRCARPHAAPPQRSALAWPPKLATLKFLRGKF